MELEYKDPSRRGRYIIVLGIVLAVAAGIAAFFLINQAQQQAATTTLEKVSIVVATRAIPARKPIEAGDVTIRQVPADDTTTQGTFDDVSKVLNRIPGVTILAGQPVTSNMLASDSEGGQFSILKPEETVAPDSPYWRALSITVPDDRAVAGMLQVGNTVDVFLTAMVNVPQSLLDQGKYYTDKSTKIVYQDLEILARSGTSYIIRAPLAVAEEIEHLEATGNAEFSMVLRPLEDTRIADASKLGSTTNLIITRYGLPIPETYPAGKGPVILPGTGSAQPSPNNGVTPLASPSPGASTTP